MEDVQAIYRLSKEILEKEKISYVEEEVLIKPEKQKVTFDDESSVDLPPQVPDLAVKKPRKKRKSEVEKLKIDMKGWDM